MKTEIEKHISDLLVDHDCVIIPEFGGFVGNYRSARLDSNINRFSPPSKEISFNKNLVKNDGLLANRLSASNRINYEAAHILLKKYSDELKSDLTKGKKIELHEIGLLFMDENRNIRFEPAELKNFLTDSFGLHSFHAIALEKPQIKEPSLREKTVAFRFDDRMPETEKKEKNENEKKITISGKRKYFYYTAMSIPVLFFLLWLPFNIHKIKLAGDKAVSYNYSNLIPFSDDVAPVYNERESIPRSFSEVKTDNPITNINDSVDIAGIDLFDNNTQQLVRLKKAAAMAGLNTTADNTFRFHIIGGCFQFYDNAEKKVEDLRKKGFNSAIVDKHKGLYRVCIQSFSHRNDALALLSQVQNNSDRQAWLLVK